MNSNLKCSLIILLSFLIFTEGIVMCKLHKSSQGQPEEGERIKYLNTNFTFSLPKNWKYNWNRNKTELIITPQNISSPAEFVKMTVRDLESGEKDMNILDLLLKQSKEIVKMSPIPITLNPIIGPEDVKIDNLKAGRYISEADPFGNRALTYEGFIGGVKDETVNKVLFLYAAYLQKKYKEIRPGMDMILKSIKNQ